MILGLEPTTLLIGLIILIVVWAARDVIALVVLAIVGIIGAACVAIVAFFGVLGAVVVEKFKEAKKKRKIG